MQKIYLLKILQNLQHCKLYIEWFPITYHQPTKCQIGETQLMSIFLGIFQKVDSPFFHFYH